MTPPNDQPSPVERRLDEHLELLRSRPPQPPGALVSTVVHAARWQGAIRQPLLAIAGVLAAMTDGVRVLFGSRGRRS